MKTVTKSRSVGLTGTMAENMRTEIPVKDARAILGRAAHQAFLDRAVAYFSKSGSSSEYEARISEAALFTKNEDLRKACCRIIANRLGRKKARCACGLAVRRAVLDMAREPAWLAIIKEAERIGAHRGVPYAVS